jgi:AcrR family transcriptional regulator
MPKETFFNLEEGKRHTILSNAYREFAVHDYTHASLSRIVEESGIAKGSMYQYFDDKKDLYFYLLEQASEKKLSYISEHLEERYESFFDQHKRIVLLGTYFDFTYPQYSLILINAMNSPLHPDLGDLAGELRTRSEEYLREFVEYAVCNGEIRQDIDLQLVVHSINQLTISLGEYVEKRYRCSLIDLLSSAESELPFSFEDLGVIIEQLICVIRTGLDSAVFGGAL